MAAIAMTMFDTTRDSKGIMEALSDLLEESFLRSRVAGTFTHCDEDTERRIEDSLPQRKLSPGYYRLATYLLRLEQWIKLGTISGGFTAFETEGLCLVEQAHNEFSERHPRCTACGAAQESRFAPSCCVCQASFRKEDR